MSTGPVPAADLSALDSNGAGLRVRFLWRDDRYHHQIEAVEGSRSQTLLESVEGDQLDNWPPSPPWQHVSVSWITSDTQQGHVAMLVGGAGRSHWSMCVSARDWKTYSSHKSMEEWRNIDRERRIDRQSDETELSFDVACRISDAPQFLGSTYNALFQQVAISDKLNCAFVPANAPGLVLAARDAQIELEATHTLTPILRCRVTDVGLTGFPATIRWRYAVRRSSGGPLYIRTNALRS